MYSKLAVYTYLPVGAMCTCRHHLGPPGGLLPAPLARRADTVPVSSMCTGFEPVALICPVHILMASMLKDVLLFEIMEASSQLPA